MPSQFQISQAVNIIQSGGVIAYATEAVYGLGCDPENAHAIQRILEIKGRKSDQGFILIAANATQVNPYLGKLSDNENQALEKNWETPTTLILPANENVSDLITGGRNTIAVRITQHAASKALCEALKHPLISTSANISGQAAIRTRWQLGKTFSDSVDYIFPSTLGMAKKASRIIHADTGCVLRS